MHASNEQGYTLALRSTNSSFSGSLIPLGSRPMPCSACWWIRHCIYVFLINLKTARDSRTITEHCPIVWEIAQGYVASIFSSSEGMPQEQHRDNTFWRMEEGRTFTLCSPQHLGDHTPASHARPIWHPLINIQCQIFNLTWNVWKK